MIDAAWTGFAPAVVEAPDSVRLTQVKEMVLLSALLTRRWFCHGNEGVQIQRVDMGPRPPMSVVEIEQVKQIPDAIQHFLHGFFPYRHLFSMNNLIADGHTFIEHFKVFLRWIKYFPINVLFRR